MSLDVSNCHDVVDKHAIVACQIVLMPHKLTKFLTFEYVVVACMSVVNRVTQQMSFIELIQSIISSNKEKSHYCYYMATEFKLFS